MQQDMRLDNVRCKGHLVGCLPWIGRGAATALYPNIYLPKTVYNDIFSDSPDPYNIALVLHEQEHISRIRQVGVLRWYVRYLLSRHFRFEEELVAIEPQIAYLKHAGLSFDFERKARQLSSWLYLWAVSYEEAAGRLRELRDDTRVF